jgi:phosphohistidine swiveling domain-containing protein
VEWERPENSQYQWFWNDAHNPEPLLPLAVEMDRLGAAGRLRAFDEAGVIAPPNFRGWQPVHGFQYLRGTPLPPHEMREFVARAAALTNRHGSTWGVWEQHCRPRMEAACHTLQAAGLGVPLQSLAETWSYGFYMSFVSIATLQPPTMRMLSLLEPFGPEAPLLQFEILAGGANASMEGDRAIWEMGQMAKASADVRALLDAAGGRVPASAASSVSQRTFVEAHNRYIDSFGLRTTSWNIGALTLREQPEVVLGMIRQAMAAPRPPDAVEAESLARREAARKRAEQALAAEPEKVEELRRIVRLLEGYVGIREGRAHWQLTAHGSLRGALLRRGAAMVEGGAIAEAADIFFLRPAEIDASFGGGPGSLTGLVETRRADWQSWLGVKPPQWIGNPDAARGPMPIAQESTTSGGVQGLPASRGVVTARARVMRDLEGGEQLQPGEILVCPMTSPAWTPMFAIAAGIVTDAGAPLSHPAITAREYGIPAVVGAKGATSRIKTGDLITVDGLAGTVRLERG